MAEFSHRYSITKCPDCGADLTAKHSVRFNADGDGLAASVSSNLTADGELVDVYQLIAKGLHTGSVCSKCELPLDEYELWQKDSANDGEEELCP